METLLLTQPIISEGKELSDFRNVLIIFGKYTKSFEMVELGIREHTHILVKVPKPI